MRAEAWPGNLCQLGNVPHRAHAVALSRGVEGDVRALGARALAHEALRAKEAGRTLELDHWQAFEGLLLEEAISLMGGVDEAFELLGRGGMLVGRNHNKLLKRARGRVSALAKELKR